MSSDSPVSVSVFEGQYDKDPKRENFPSFKAFLDKLFEDGHVASAEKANTPAFCPVTFAGSRAKSNAERVYFGVLDLDGLTLDDLGVLSSRLEDLRVAWAFYTSFSYKGLPGPIKGRLLVPFSTPIPASKWKFYWPRLNYLLGNYADRQTKDVSRLFFIPACPQPYLKHAIIERHDEGGAISLSLLDSVQLPAAALVAQGATEVISREDLEDLIKRLRSKKPPVARRLQKVLDGEPFADQGERDVTAFKLAGALVQAFPEAKAESLARLFEASCAAMADQEGALTVEGIEAKIVRHQEDLAAQQELLEKEQNLLRARDLQESGRETEYSPEEVNTAEGPTQPWIVQKGSTFYTFFIDPNPKVGGHYKGPYTLPEAPNAARRDLAPAFSQGVETYKLTNFGDLILKSPQQLVQEYGTVASSVVYDMTAKGSRYDKDTRELIFQGPKLVDVNPAFSQVWDKWLRLLAEDKYPKLVEWLSLLPHLTHPLCALYLEGSKGQGKTLLAKLCAGLWQGAPAEAEGVFNNFNDELVRNPVIVAEETFPTKYGRPQLDEFRRIIDRQTHSINPKHLPRFELRGCVRMIITANHKDLLTSEKHLNPHELEATTARLFHVHCAGPAAAYLEKLKDRIDDLKPQFHGHVLWLYAQRQKQGLKGLPRFGVDVTDDREIVEHMNSQTGIVPLVTQWLIGYLSNTAPLDNEKGRKAAVIKDGRIYCSGHIADHWDKYLRTTYVPTAYKIGQSLQVLSLRRTKVGGGNYYEIDPEKLKAFANSTGYGSESVIDLTLARGASGLALVK